MKFILSLFVMLAFSIVSYSEHIDLTLSISETAGIDRQQWPVIVGVPLPKGSLHSLDKLQIVDGNGRFVPARFVPAGRFWDDGSVSWVHCDFAATVPAMGQVAYHLRDVMPLPDFPSPIGFIPRGKDFEIITGPLRLVLGGRSNQLLDQVWVDEGWGYNFSEANKILESGNFELVLKSGSRIYRTQNWADTRIVVEDHGPLRATVRITGSFALEGQKERSLDYIARLTVFGGKTYFTLDLSLLNQPETTADAQIDELSLVSRLNLNPDQKFTFGIDSGALTGNFAKVTQAALVQTTPTRYHFDLDETDSLGAGKIGHSTGWADLSDDDLGLSVALRSFWRLYPKAFVARNDGNLTVNLIPSEIARSQVQVRLPQTYQLLMYFHGRRQWESGQVETVLRGFQRPLYVVAPSRWYCRSTRALGKLIESPAADMNAGFRTLAAQVDSWIVDSRDTWKVHRDADRESSSGLSLFGASVGQARANTVSPEIPEYTGGFTHALYMHFLRTGDINSVEAAEDVVAEVADEALARDQGRALENVGFLEIQGLFDSYLITANRRYLEAAKASLSRMLGQSPDKVFRSPGDVAITLEASVRAYEVTGDRRWLDAARAQADQLAAWQDGNVAQLAKEAQLLASSWAEAYKDALGKSAEESGISMEALRQFADLTHERSWLNRLRRAADWVENNPREWDAENKSFVKSPLVGLAMAPALGAIFEDTGEKKYWNWARSIFSAALGGPKELEHPARLGRSLTSSQQFLWFLSSEFGASGKQEVSSIRY